MYTLKPFAMISMVLYFSPAEGSWVQLRAGASHAVALAVTKRRPQSNVEPWELRRLRLQKITGPSGQGCLDPMEKKCQSGFSYRSMNKCFI